MPDSWQRRIDRATALAGADPSSKAILTQYAAMLDAQRSCYNAFIAMETREALRLGGRLSGSLDLDLLHVRMCATHAFSTLCTSLPPEVIGCAPDNKAELVELLQTGWHSSSPPFLARLVLQPYAEALAKLGRPPQGRRIPVTPRRAVCPFCGGPPQVSVLRRDNGSDGGGRELICALCSTSWPLRRILCVNCGEEDEHRLKYFHAPEFDYVRVDACDRCRHYVKTVDLTRLGIAVPVVDEVASGALDIWALDRGLTKVELNLLGL